MPGVLIGIKRFGDSVQISFKCTDDYHAIEVYDHLVDGAKKGKVTIDLKKRPGREQRALSTN
jgi:hypothetical protein